MGKYFCPECGYEGDEPMCPHCNIPAEILDYPDTEFSGNEKYPNELIKDDLSEDEITDDNIDLENLDDLDDDDKSVDE